MAEASEPSPDEQEHIAAFCRAEHQLLTGKRALAQHKKPLLVQKRDTLQKLTARLQELGINGVNIRVDQQCWKVCRKRRTTKQAVTPGMVKRSLGTVPAASTLEELSDWIWAQLQEARTKVRSVLDLRPSKVDLCTQLPPDVQLGGGADEREEAEDRCREELQAVMTEHCRAKAELAQLQQSYNGQCQALRKESTAAHPGVLAYMDRAQVALQPIRLGGEQFAMRRRETSRSKALSRQADIKGWIQETLAQLLPGVAGSQQLTPEQQATCVAELPEALVRGLPRNQGIHVSLLSSPGPK